MMPLKPKPKPKPKPNPTAHAPNALSSPSSRPKSKLAAVDLAVPAQAVELGCIVNVLALAHHRNKNQHRRSRWWKELGVLRRNLRRLMEGWGTLGTGDGLAREERIAFLRERVFPRCWVAFSGVVADNQYAVLGLMLLGTLGRLGRVLGVDLQGESEEAIDGGVEALGEGEVGRKGMGQQGGEDGHDGEDLGVPLEREVMVKSEAEEGDKSDMKRGRPELEGGVAESPLPLAKKKKKKKHGDAIDDIFSGLT